MVNVMLCAAWQGIDIQFLRHIQGRATIIPIIAKADTVHTPTQTTLNTPADAQHTAATMLTRRIAGNVAHGALRGMRWSHHQPCRGT